MEESGELGRMAASQPPGSSSLGAPTGNKPSKSKTREEGELTSSEEDVLPTCSDAPSTGASVPVTLSSKANAVSVDGQRIKPGFHIPTHYPRSVQSKVSIHQPISQKGYKLKSKVPTKSRWQASHATESNLIISFSEDDSDSESESQGLQKAPESNRNYPVAPVQRTMRNDGKVLADKVMINKGPSSSLLRFAGPKQRNVGSSLVEPRYSSMHSTSMVKNLAIQDHSLVKGGGLNDGKLQDLRQQIAMRENELKLKTGQFVQQNKENLSESSKELRDLKHNSVVSRRSRLSSSEPKEPDAKRLRLNDSSLGQSISLPCDKASMKSAFPSKELVLTSSYPHMGSTVDNRQGREDADIEALQTSCEAQLQEKQCPPSSATVKSSLQDRFTANFTSSNLMSRSRSSLGMSRAPFHANVSSGKLPKSPDPDRLGGNEPLGHALCQARLKEGGIKNKDRQDVVLGNDKFKSDSNFQVHSVQASPNGGSPSNDQDVMSHPGCGVTLLSLIKAEAYHDKQLEEAQELRRKCEIEERNAFKAYREAQRALASANAQCSYFYRLRESFSARVRSVMMEDPSLFMSSKQQEQLNHEWNFLHHVSGADVDPYSMLHAENDVVNHFCNGSNVQTAEVDAQNRTSPNVDGHTLSSEPCGEPDASTSEIGLHKDNEAANALSPCNDPNLSSDEYDETFACEHTSCRSNPEFQRNKGCGRKSETMIDGSAPNLSNDNFQKSIDREAQLRSELFSRLQMFASSRRIGTNVSNGNRIHKVAESDVASCKAKMNVERSPSPNATNEQLVGFVSPEGALMDMAGEGAQDHDIDAKSQFLKDNVLLTNQGKNQVSDVAGSGMCKESINKIQSVGQSAMYCSPDSTVNFVDCPLLSERGSRDLVAASVLRSAVYQMKGVCPVISNHVQASNQHDSPSYWCNEERTVFFEVTLRNQLIGGIDPYTSNSIIDPFWPLCMYELRGKCNDEECPWQHTNDDSGRKLRQHMSSTGAGSQAGLAQFCQNQGAGTHLSHISIPPTYLVCFDSLTLDSYSRDPLTNQKYRSCCIKFYSLCLAVLQHSVSTDEPVLHGNYHGCIETRAPSRQSLYAQNISDPMISPADRDKIMETALVILSQDVNNVERTRKCLSLLTQALDDDPTCSHLWVVYLLVYYSKMNLVGDEDFFSCAVKHNEGSYELWLIYINSCRLLKDQFAAYDRAISSMCHKLPAGDVDHHSAFVLDLFLQMLHCYCISGNVEKAIKRIYGLVNDGKYSDSLLLSDILKCLTMSDKYVFWVCCVYLFLYRKLPDAVVMSFEFEKDITVVDWPDVQVTKEEKELAYKMIEMALDCFKLHVNSAVPDDRTAFEPAHQFAFSHVKLVRVLDGLESCEELMENYVDQYPTCVELVLLSAQICSEKDGQKSISVFEKAIRNWPEDVPGIQVIWNQYVEYALRIVGYYSAENVLLRWFDSFSKVPSCLNGIAYDNGSDERNCFIDSSPKTRMNSSGSRPPMVDLMFEQLNRSLYMLMQNDVLKAYSAIDKALRHDQGEYLRYCIREHGTFMFQGEYLRYCIREHATFMFNYGSHMGRDVSIHKIPSILNSYAASIDLPVKEPLSRIFIQQIQKPRVRQLLEGNFGPLSPDFSMLNLILESWFGPSLLPQNFEKTKEMVDLVESILDTSPANYPLAMSVCKRLIQATSDVAETTIFFWASSILVNTIYQSVPVPPECVWVEAFCLLGALKGIDKAVCESFYRKALSVYPFSAELYKLYLNSSLSDNCQKSVVEAARTKGIDYEKVSV